ncbi:hypothetical protein [Polaribacter septentrionalilitoris]|uniref:hypothetical protein n=1 Tax=Polaribacter septentrionalilitoris TaxID=2494657 RepID=UPI001358A5EC|nr:hypothetical protein [Polaribacter septentrionalilitoris]
MKNNKVVFIILTSITIILSQLNKEFLNIENLIFNSMIENYTETEVRDIINYKEKLKWLSYLVIPLLLIIKISITSMALDVGCFIFGKNVKYKKLFNIVVRAEFIFLLVIIFKTSWFYLFQTNYTLEDLQNFYPLSALNIIGYKGLDPWFIYPFQVLNLFEIAYWFILAYLISKEINETTEKGFSIVASSYGVGLLIWVVSVVFLTLNMS